MVIVTIKQDEGNTRFEGERYDEFDLLVSAVLCVADKRTKIEIETTEESEASRLQGEANRLKEKLKHTFSELLETKAKLQKYEEAGEDEAAEKADTCE